MSVFMISYAIGQGVFGGLFDKLGARIGFTLSIGVWSIATILHGIATTVTSFSIFRFLLGFSEAGNWPGATKVNAEWFPVKERALAQGIFNAGGNYSAVFGLAATFVPLCFISVLLGGKVKRVAKKRG